MSDVADTKFVENFYTEENKYMQKGDVFTWPLRILINGQSGFGKTSLLANISLKHLVFDTLTMFAAAPDQEPLKKLTDAFRKRCIDNDIDPKTVLHISQFINRKVDDYSPDVQHLVVIDDKASKKDKEAYKVLEYVTKSRPRNMSVIIITQDYHAVLPEIRANCNALASYYVQRKRDRTAIGGDFAPGIETKLFHDMLDYCFVQHVANPEKEVDLDAFFCIPNTKQRVLGLKYMHAFHKYSLFNDEGKLRIYDHSMKRKPSNTSTSSSDEDAKRAFASLMYKKAIPPDILSPSPVNSNSEAEAYSKLMLNSSKGDPTPFNMNTLASSLGTNHLLTANDNDEGEDVFITDDSDDDFW